AVVKPYLANKKDKTFLDHWLLGDDVSGYLDPWQHGRLNTVERVLLAQRLAGEQPKTARHLGDLLALLPPNVGRDLLLFDTAIQAGEFATESSAEMKVRIINGSAPLDRTFTPLGMPAGGSAPAPGLPPPTDPKQAPRTQDRAEELEKLQEKLKESTRDLAGKRDGHSKKGGDGKASGDGTMLADE